MKHLLITLAVCIFGTVASANDRQTDQVLRLTNRVNQLINAKVYDLSSVEKDEVLDHLKAIRRVIRGGGNNGGGGHGRLHIVQGDVEGKHYTFEARDLNELFGLCKPEVQSMNIPKADDIKVSVDYGSVHALRNSTSWWDTSTDICLQIVQVADSEGVSVSRRSARIILLGTIEEKHEFYFSGDTLRDIDTQCQQFVRKKRITQADDITVSSGFRTSKKLRNDTTWWEGPVEICGEIIRNR